MTHYDTPPRAIRAGRIFISGRTSFAALARKTKAAAGKCPPRRVFCRDQLKFTRYLYPGDSSKHRYSEPESAAEIAELLYAPS